MQWNYYFIEKILNVRNFAQNYEECDNKCGLMSYLLSLKYIIIGEINLWKIATILSKKI